MKDIQRRITRMVKEDEANQKMFNAMERMWHMYWDLPAELSELDWIRREVSSDPHDAIRAGTRVLATVMPKLSIAPLLSSVENREAMDRIERGLMWHFENATKRANSPLYDMVKHAMLYDKVAVQVVFLPWQEKLLGKQWSEHQKRNARRFGPYALIVRNPKDVFVDYSDWMTERVVHRYTMGAQELVSFWGSENARKIASDIVKSKDDGASLWYTVYDYQDYDRRLVFACQQPSETTIMEAEYSDPVILVDEEMDIPFLPWVVRSGGKELIPMLYSVYKANQWESQNIFETIMASEIIAYAAAPRGVLTSSNPDMVETVYADPNRDKLLRPGDQFQQLRPPELDQNMQIMSDRLQSRISKSTVPNVIQTGDFPSGTAYATLNLATQSGVKAMAPYKRLAEEALADVFTQMLLWIDYTGDTIESYPTNTMVATGETEYIKIAKGDFDPDHLYIRVELTPDVPTDRMQRVNAAIMAGQNLNYSNRRALEDIGVTEPGAEIEQWYEEQTRLRDWEIEQQAKAQQIQQQIELQGQAQMLQMQQAAAQPPQQQQQQQGPPNMQQLARDPRVQQMYARQRGRGFENTRSQAGFNPAIGGTPPAMANPEGTRESQQGTNIDTGEGVV